MKKCIPNPVVFMNLEKTLELNGVNNSNVISFIMISDSVSM